MIAWIKAEMKALQRLSSPARVQAFLDSIPYSSDEFYRCPRSVLRDGKAHCFDGALFGAAALRMLGYRPLLVDLRAERDDDHIVAIFSQNGHLGAVAKSNFVGLRFRDPIFRNVRELALSYFEQYYNLQWEKSLRAFSVPLDLSAFDRINWMTSDEKLELIAERLDSIRHYPLLNARMISSLSPVDARSYEAGMLGVNKGGLYDPGKHKKESH